MLYPISDYLPQANPMLAYRGRELEMSQELLAPVPTTEAQDYLEALKKEGHLVDVRRVLDTLMSTNDTPEAVYQRLAPDYDDDLDDTQNAENIVLFDLAFNDAVELIGSQVDWAGMKLPAYDLAVELGQVPAVLQ